MGVGAKIWERHGHIALCVQYTDDHREDCYNYGVASFEHPLSMAAGFFRGTHSFWVAEMSPEELLWVYKNADRTIWIQPLSNLTDEQAWKVVDKLKSDIKEENKFYAYDHFEDNCTTRVRNILDDVTHGELSSMTEPTDGKTFRDLAREGFYGMRVPLLITDIAMGRSTDRVPTYYERMFLPQYLREAVTKKWHIQPRAFYTRRECVNSTESGCVERGLPWTPENSGRVIFALFALLITAPVVLSRRYRRFQRTALAVAVIPYALLGSILLFLAVISPLPYVHINESILLFFPFDFLLLALPAEKRRLYARGRVAMLVLQALLMLIGVFKQPLMAELLWPLIPALVVGFWPAQTVTAATKSKKSGAKKPAAAKA